MHIYLIFECYNVSVLCKCKDKISNVFSNFGPNRYDSRFNSIHDSEKSQFDSRFYNFDTNQQLAVAFESIQNVNRIVRIAEHIKHIILQLGSKDKNVHNFLGRYVQNSALSDQEISVPSPWLSPFTYMPIYAEYYNFSFFYIVHILHNKQGKLHILPVP